MEKQSIKIGMNLKDKLNKLGKKNDTYHDIIEKLVQKKKSSKKIKK